MFKISKLGSYPEFLLKLHFIEKVGMTSPKGKSTVISPTISSEGK